MSYCEFHFPEKKRQIFFNCEFNEPQKAQSNMQIRVLHEIFSIKLQKHHFSIVQQTIFCTNQTHTGEKLFEFKSTNFSVEFSLSNMRAKHKWCEYTTRKTVARGVYFIDNYCWNKETRN